MKNVNSLALCFLGISKLEPWSLLLHTRKSQYLHIPLVEKSQAAWEYKVNSVSLNRDDHWAELGFPSFSILDYLLLVLAKFLQHTKTGLLKIQISACLPFSKIQEGRKIPLNIAAPALWPPTSIQFRTNKLRLCTGMLFVHGLASPTYPSE